MDDQEAARIGQAYRENGYASPITVMSPAEAGELRREMEAIERSGDAELVKNVLVSNTQFVLRFCL